MAETAQRSGLMKRFGLKNKPSISTRPIPVIKEKPIEQPNVQEIAEPTIPQWFRDNCVITSAQWSEKPDCLRIRVAETGEVSTKPDATAAKPGGDLYELDSELFELINGVLPEPPSSSSDSDTTIAADSAPREGTAMLLRFPHNSKEKQGEKFLRCVVEHLAKSISADLVTFSADDIEDMVRYFKQTQVGLDHNARYARDIGLPDIAQHMVGLPDIASVIATLTTDPITKPVPLIVHLPCINDTYKDQEYMLQAIAAALKDQKLNAGRPAVIALLTTDGPAQAEEGDEDSDLDEKIIGLFVNETPLPKAVRVVPCWSKPQKLLFHKDQQLEHPLAHSTIRAIQRALRKRLEGRPPSPLTEPYSDWSFLQQPSVIRNLTSKKFTDEEIQEAVRHIGYNVDPARIEKAILRLSIREEVYDAWSKVGEHVEENTQWVNFAPHIREKIHKIENEPEFEKEKRLLPLLVDPGSLADGWGDIALEADIKEAISQVVDQFVSNKSTRGVMKRGRIGGALLYGPPGTGKTQLARVLAAESGAVVICASAAEIMDKYIGEAEKIIQALFKLGRLLSPGIIFIDEADALFRARGAEQHGWERSRTNQLLNEMDGLTKASDAPFVLLASNYPHELDHAVLRRVPSRLHIGLPSANMRKVILKIALRDDEVDPGLDYEFLTAKTKRFSGSDIYTLCIHAALICDADRSSEDGDEIKPLKQEHFEKALQRTSPTVHRTALENIKEFAKDSDPVAFERIIAADNEK